MSDPVAFLRARLDEDEAAAKAAWGVEWDWRYVAHPFGERPSIAHTVHIARHDPARVLREVAAKRALIDRYRDAVAARESDDDPWLQALFDQILDECAVYSDHPDYDQEGRP